MTDDENDVTIRYERRGDLQVGQTFGRLMVIAPPIVGGRTMVPCRCQCGTERTFRMTHLRSGATRSCGCWRKDQSRAKTVTHGASRSPEHIAWAGMIARCENARNHAFSRYGGRGITVDPTWRHSFEAFLADMGHKPTPEHSLDRIDVDGSYEPGNCRWATKKEQARNTRSNRRIQAFGETLTLAQWAERTGIGEATIRRRLRVGCDPERALTQRVRGCDN